MPIQFPTYFSDVTRRGEEQQHRNRTRVRNEDDDNNSRRGRVSRRLPRTEQPIAFNALQTFFVDPNAVDNASEIMLTSIELFFKSKPSTENNTSGSTAPGVTVSICEVINDVPDTEQLLMHSIVRVPYEQIYSFSDASVPTIFKFTTPVILETGRAYGIIISFEDAHFKLWLNKKGNRLVGTNVPSPGSSNKNDGQYFLKTNSGEYAAQTDTDLKYRVNIAKFSANTIQVNLVNRDFEFITYSNKTGSFTGGEYVYQVEANTTGTVSITQSNTTLTGTNTTFTSILNGDYIVVWNSSNTVQVLQVNAVTNATSLVLGTEPRFTNTSANFMICPVGTVYYRDELENKLVLVDSSANSTLKFDAAAVIRGELSEANATITSIDAHKVDKFIPRITVESTPASAIDFDYVISTSNVVNTSLLTAAILNRINYVTKYSGEILSRSTEVGLTDLYGTNKKSGLARFDINVASTTTSLFNVPRIRTDEIDFYILQSEVNNTYLNGNIDTEVYKNGLATSKYISVKTAFANNRFAEDIRVYMAAYRPIGTDIRVYAKVHNSSDTETFDDKLWTPLTYLSGGDAYSSTEKRSDLIEYELTLPSYPDTDFTVSGTFTTSLSNNVIVANGFDPSANLAVNDLVKVYNPLILENYTIGFVTAANSTTFTLSAPIANNNVVGSGYYVDKLLYKGTAFLNKENGNVCRYFTQTYSPVDKFNSMQFKIVLLANNSAIVPEVEDFQAIGLNAGS